MARNTVSRNKKAEPAVNAAAGLDSSALPDRYSDEEIATRQTAFEQKGPVVKVIQDEWYGRLEEGNPFDDAAKAFVDGNPDKHFRFLGDKQTSKRGKRSYQEVRDPETGKPVDVAGMKLHFIPKDLHKQRAKRVEEDAASALTESNDRYKEAAAKAQRDAGGAIELLPDEGQRYRGSRRAAI